MFWNIPVVKMAVKIFALAKDSLYFKGGPFKTCSNLKFPRNDSFAQFGQVAKNATMTCLFQRKLLCKAQLNEKLCEIVQEYGDSI